MGDPLSDLEKQQASLVGVQLKDFRAANLFSLVADHIPSGSRVLDVGCGAGGLVAYLRQRRVDAYGIDTSAPTIAAAQTFYAANGIEPNCLSVKSTDVILSEGARYDVVVCMDCLEHVEDDQSLFDELLRVVRPGGVVIITVPALMALYGERDVRIGHYRRYSKARLLSLVDTSSIRIQTIRYWNALGVAPTFLSQKILGRNVDEGFRYGTLSLRKRLMRRALFAWFKHVENRLRPPLGMSLFMVLHRP